MAGSRIVLISFVLFFYVSPLLAGETNRSKDLQVAKNSADIFSRQNREEIPRKLRIDENYVFYDIEGTSIAELNQQMRQVGNKWNDGKTYAALTTWEIRYNYDTIEEGDNYSIKSVVTDVSVVYHLPRIAVASAAPELWETYMKNLKVHELGHKDISVKAADEINQTLAALGSFRSKTELEREANRLVKAKFKQLKELHIAYDDDTNHGIKQGAILAESDPA